MILSKSDLAHQENTQIMEDNANKATVNTSLCYLLSRFNCPLSPFLELSSNFSDSCINSLAPTVGLPGS